MRVILALGGLVHAANMNGNYSIASGRRQDVPFNTDFESKGMEYFDVWGPEIATLYGQVFWADQLMQDLPQEIITRFAGKTIAVTGYEHDQVMVQPVGHPGENPDKDVSVPINWAYNHHYQFWLTGKNSEMVWVPAAKHDPYAHGMRKKLMAVDKPSKDPKEAQRLGNGIPTNSYFSEGNGGESRKSFHGYPKGFAQLIDQPSQWHVFPMQIDTRNRECGVTPADIDNCTGAEGNPYRPGMEPKQARWARPWDRSVGTNVSGVLECPCNSRFGGDPTVYGADTPTKRTEHKYMATPGGCLDTEGLTTAADCFAAVAAIETSVAKNVTTSNPGLPQGCSIQVQGASIVATFNQGGQAPCTMTSNLIGSTMVQSTGVGLSLALNLSSSNFSFSQSPKGVYCANNRDAILKQFIPPTDSISDAQNALQKCEAFCLTTAKCWGCSADVVTPPSLAAYNAIPSCGEYLPWDGKIQGDISEKLADGNVTITITGPSAVWFAVGFNAQRMADQPWAVICNGSSVFENQIGTCGDEGQHCPGTSLAPSIQVVSNTVSGSTRTLVIKRKLQGLSPVYYSFNPSRNSTINIITAVGNSLTFSYHAHRDLGAITLANADGTPTCVCDVGFAGLLCDNNGQNCSKFVKGCLPEPDSDLLADANPTCNSVTYVGGLSCCGHERIMLDVDQDPGNVLLRYHLKVRIWFQEYVPAVPPAPPSHYDATRIYYQTENPAGEYDVPPAFVKPGFPMPGYPNWPEGKMTPGTTCTGTCPDGPDCDCIHTIHYKWPSPKMRLVYAGGHCHAPSCIDMTLYRNDTGEMLCLQLPKYGTGQPNDKYDEPNFLQLPPCLWGDDAGLNPSILIPEGTPLLSIKRNRNTYTGHFGEMASWQMRGVDF